MAPSGLYARLCHAFRVFFLFLIFFNDFSEKNYLFAADILVETTDIILFILLLVCNARVTAGVQRSTMRFPSTKEGFLQKTSDRQRIQLQEWSSPL